MTVTVHYVIKCSLCSEVRVEAVILLKQGKTSVSLLELEHTECG